MEELARTTDGPVQGRPRDTRDDGGNHTDPVQDETGTGRRRVYYQYGREHATHKSGQGEKTDRNDQGLQQDGGQKTYHEEVDKDKGGTNNMGATKAHL